MLHHVSLEVAPDDVERSVEFFTLLGFQRLAAPDPIAPFVTWLEADGTQIHFIHTPEPTTPALGHPAVVPPEFALAVTQLREAGFEVPDFWLSDDGLLFVMARFDRTPEGEALGFEDMSVLTGNEKYRGSLRRSGCGSSELLQTIQPENRSRSEGDLSDPSSVFGFNTNQQPKEIVCRNQK